MKIYNFIPLVVIIALVVILCPRTPGKCIYPLTPNPPTQSMIQAQAKIEKQSNEEFAKNVRSINLGIKHSLRNYINND